jgi:hypothetical protein
MMIAQRKIFVTKAVVKMHADLKNVELIHYARAKTMLPTAFA